MRIKLIAVGTRMPSWVTEGYNEYARRLHQDIQLQLIEIPLAKRGKNADFARLMEKEGKQMLAATHTSDYIVALDMKGECFTTGHLSSRLKSLMQDGKHLSVFIGGPEGLAKNCSTRADEKWSLSDLTLPHPLARVLFVEQIYRSWTIIKGHPYHR
jgi:23S rRNA (pseudouridine1915-N3)-methyltransferase